MDSVDADIFAFQEVKADSTKFPSTEIRSKGYHYALFDAKKKGYSGVTVLSKEKPIDVINGCGIEEYDNEGRTQLVVFKDFTLLNVYMPSGSNPDRQIIQTQVFKEFSKIC